MAESLCETCPNRDKSLLARTGRGLVKISKTLQPHKFDGLETESNGCDDKGPVPAGVYCVMYAEGYPVASVTEKRLFKLACPQDYLGEGDPWDKVPEEVRAVFADGTISTYTHETRRPMKIPSAESIANLNDRISQVQQSD